MRTVFEEMSSWTVLTRQLGMRTTLNKILKRKFLWNWNWNCDQKAYFQDIDRLRNSYVIPCKEQVDRTQLYAPLLQCR